MEFCNRGDLQNLIKRAKDKQVSGLKEAVIWNISLQIVLGLHYLHRKKILHRDLKSANVFLTKDSDSCKPSYSVKIGDLGVAKLMDTSTAFANTIVGTPYYLSPELCADMPYRGEDMIRIQSNHPPYHPSIHPSSSIHRQKRLLGDGGLDIRGAMPCISSLFISLTSPRAVSCSSAPPYSIPSRHATSAHSS